MGTSNGMHVMKFTQDGKHVLTIGEPGVNKGSNDPDHLGGPANFYVDPKTNELFIADGYINKRVVVYDAATGKYKRHWGAYGKRPDDTQKYQYPVNPKNPPQQYPRCTAWSAPRTASSTSRIAAATASRCSARTVNT